MSKIIKINKNKGFTLVELLIAISLIAILSGVLFSVINPAGIRSKTRDSQRVADLAKIKVALESYFADNRMYPIPVISGVLSSDTWVSVSTLSSQLETSHINLLPPDPSATGVHCSTSTWRGYVYKTNGSTYVLATNMETNNMGSLACPNSLCSNTPVCVFTGGTGYYTSAD